MSQAGILGRYSSTIRNLRMFGYTVVLAVHAFNSIALINTYKGDILKDPDLAFFSNNRWSMLTLWNVVNQVIYSALGLFCDIMSIYIEGKPSSLLKTLEYIRNVFFSALVFPISAAVCIHFWCIHSYNPTWVSPAIVFKTMPWMANHVLHTFVVPAVLWEVIFRPRKIPSSHLLNLTVLNTYTVVFIAVCYYTRYLTGRFPYNILHIADGTPYLYVAFLSCSIGHNLYYKLQWYITEFLWGNGKENKEKEKVK